MRIASLLPSGTELVCALGLRDQLVGVSHECDYPADVTSLPRLTSSILDHGLTPAQIDAAVAASSLERRPLYSVDGALLSSLKPDLIVTQGVCAVCAVSEETVQQTLCLLPVTDVTKAPVLSLTGMAWQGIRADIQALGEATGTAERARALLDELDARWAAVAALPPPQQPPTVAMLEWPDPHWFGGHWVPEQVAVAGGVDPFGTPGEPSGRLSAEALAEADPDLLLGIACGFGVEDNARHLREVITRSPELRAVREGGVWALDANGLFSRPGPRVVDGAELLARLFRGQPVTADRAVQL